MGGGADSQNFGDIYQPIFQHKSSQMWVGGAYEARYKADFRFFEILVNMEKNVFFWDISPKHGWMGAQFPK